MIRTIIATVVLSSSITAFAADVAMSDETPTANTPVAQPTVDDNVPGGVNTFFKYNEQCKATLNSAQAVTSKFPKQRLLINEISEDLDLINHMILLVTNSNEAETTTRFIALTEVNNFTANVVYNLELLEVRNPKLTKKIEAACGLENRQQIVEGYAPSYELFDFLTSN